MVITYYYICLFHYYLIITYYVINSHYYLLLTVELADEPCMWARRQRNSEWLSFLQTGVPRMQ